MSFTIEGEWTGYTSSQRRVVHREHTRSQRRVDEIRKLGSILYTDGTSLLLSVRDGKRGTPVNGYRSLIADCIRHGVKAVADLPR
jgi:hypothetical protein